MDPDGSYLFEFSNGMGNFVYLIIPFAKSTNSLVTTDMNGIDLSTGKAPISSFGISTSGNVVLSAFNLINSMDYNIFYSITSSDSMSTILISNFYYKSAS